MMLFSLFYILFIKKINRHFMCAPVVIFAFNRSNKLFELLSSLTKCSLSNKTDVIIYIDGPRNAVDEIEIGNVTSVAEIFVDNFLSLSINRRELNVGLATSLRDGISQCFEITDKLIIIEDDLVVSRDFLTYMNQSLSQYYEVKNVGSISGFSFDDAYSSEFDNFFVYRPTSWGWATWKDRWDSSVWDYKINSFSEKIKFWIKSRKAGQDIYRMYNNNKAGKINSWAILWVVYHLENNLISSYPKYSKVSNNGFGDKATHCSGENPYPVKLCDTDISSFNLIKNVSVSENDLSTFNNYYSNRYKLITKFKRGVNWIVKSI